MQEIRILKIKTKGTKRQCKESFEMIEAICDIEVEYAVAVGKERMRGVKGLYRIIFEEK